MRADIFTDITKYDKSENRFTASLVYLIKYLLDDKKNEEVHNFLTDLCGADFTPDEKVSVEMLRHEKEEEKGGIIPDFEIMSDNILVWVEVKDTAPLSQDLNDYKRTLKQKSSEYHKNDSRLVLLRHYFVDQKEGKKADIDIKWSLLYRYLNKLSEKFDEGTVSRYLLEQFLQYLEEKGVPIVEQIKRENVENGFRALVSLFTVIQGEAPRVFEEKGLKLKVTKITCGSEHMSFYLDKREGGEKGYCVELWAQDPPQDPLKIWLCTKRKHIFDLEGRRVVGSRLKEKLDEEKDEEKFEQDEDGWIYTKRPLTTALQEGTAEKQSDAIHDLLAEMFNDFEYIKTKPRRETKSKKIRSSK